MYKSAPIAALFIASLIPKPIAAQEVQESTAIETAAFNDSVAPMAVPVDPVTATAAAFSIAASLHTLFGGSDDNDEILGKLDIVIAQNREIAQNLREVLMILESIDEVIREENLRQSIVDQQAEIKSIEEQVLEVRRAELRDWTFRFGAARRYRAFLPDLRDRSQQLRQPVYGFVAADTVGHGMLLDLWISERIGEQSVYRSELARSYVRYFERAVDENVTESPAAQLKDLQEQRATFQLILDSADNRINRGYSAIVARNIETDHRTIGLYEYWRAYDVQQIARGNQQIGYSFETARVNWREERRRESDPDRRGGIRDLGAEFAQALDDPTPPNTNRPDANVAYWNLVRLRSQELDGEITTLQNLVRLLTFYRDRAQSYA